MYCAREGRGIEGARSITLFTSAFPTTHRLHARKNVRMPNRLQKVYHYFKYMYNEKGTSTNLRRDFNPFFVSFLS
jgi:hypothetical protein